jgi:glycine hydroxymethyltransferase
MAASDAFRETQQRIQANARALGAALADRGDRLVSGGTDNHMVLVDLRGRGITGDIAVVAREEAGILTNRNVIPFDPGTPDRPSGLRLGTTSVSQRGMHPNDMPAVAERIDAVLGEASRLRA